MSDQLVANKNWKDQLQNLISVMGELEQTPCPLKHYFLPGTYIREIFMPAGTVVVGKIHKTEHFNIIQKGKVGICQVEGPMILEGPCTFTSKAGVQKTLFIIEDTVWSTVHLTDLRDLETLEAALIEPDPLYLNLDRSEERLAIQHAAAAESNRLAITSEQKL